MGLHGQWVKNIIYKRSIELLLHTVTYVVLPGSVIRNSPHAEDPKRVGNRAGRLVWYGTCRFRLVPDMNWSVGPERTSRGIKWKKKGNKKESSLSLRNPKSVLKNDPAPSISLTSLSLNICEHLILEIAELQWRDLIQSQLGADLALFVGCSRWIWHLHQWSIFNLQAWRRFETRLLCPFEVMSRIFQTLVIFPNKFADFCFSK